MTPAQAITAALGERAAGLGGRPELVERFEVRALLTRLRDAYGVTLSPQAFAVYVRRLRHEIAAAIGAESVAYSPAYYNATARALPAIVVVTYRDATAKRRTA